VKDCLHAHSATLSKTSLKGILSDPDPTPLLPPLLPPPLREGEKGETYPKRPLPQDPPRLRLRPRTPHPPHSPPPFLLLLFLPPLLLLPLLPLPLPLLNNEREINVNSVWKGSPITTESNIGTTALDERSPSSARRALQNKGKHPSSIKRIVLSRTFSKESQLRLLRNSTLPSMQLWSPKNHSFDQKQLEKPFSKS